MKKSFKFAVALAALIILLVLSVINKQWNGFIGISIGLVIALVVGFVSHLLYSGGKSFVEAYGKWIPNTLTLGNLCLGMAAILLVAQDPNSIIPALFILLASILDAFDGKLARRWDAVSDIGKQLDSLSDLVTFGIAPMILLWNSTLSYLGIFGAFFVFFYAASGAYRLARYNVTKDCSSFMGMPITCAGILSALWYLSPYKALILPTAIWVVFLAVAMVSKVKFKRIGDYRMVKGMKNAADKHKCKKIARKSAKKVS